MLWMAPQQAHQTGRQGLHLSQPFVAARAIESPSVSPLSLSLYLLGHLRCNTLLVLFLLLFFYYFEKAYLFFFFEFLSSWTEFLCFIFNCFVIIFPFFSFIFPIFCYFPSSPYTFFLPFSFSPIPWFSPWLSGPSHRTICPPSRRKMCQHQIHSHSGKLAATSSRKPKWHLEWI